MTFVMPLIFVILFLFADDTNLFYSHNDLSCLMNIIIQKWQRYLLGSKQIDYQQTL